MPTAWDRYCRRHEPQLTTGYLLWKHLGVEIEEPARHAGLSHDDGDELVRGKELAELRVLFPELKVGGVTPEQAYYEGGVRSYWKRQTPDRGADREIFWLGDTTWGLELRDGRGQSLRYAKG